MERPRHPAKFNDVMIPLFAALAIGTQAKTVLDPMAGVGKLGLIKRHGYTGRIICNELEPEWLTPIPEGVDEVHFTDAALMPWASDGSIDMIITSPTYGNRMADHHNARDGSHRNTYRHCLGRPLTAGNTGMMQWGAKYRQKHREIWRRCRQVLSPSGVLVVNVSDHIRRGEVVGVSDWHLRVLSRDFGMTLAGYIRIPTPRLRFGANRQMRVPCEWVMIFRPVYPGVIYIGRDDLQIIGYLDERETALLSGLEHAGYECYTSSGYRERVGSDAPEVGPE